MSAQNTKQEDIINIRETLLNYLIHWKWFLVSTLIFLGIGILYLLKTNNQYEIKTSVLIKQEDNSGVSELSILEDLGLSTGKNNIDNETQIFQSADLMKSTINAINFNTSYSINQGLRKVKIYPSPINITAKNLLSDTLQDAIEFEIKPIENNQYEITATYLGQSYDEKAAILPAQIKLPFGTFEISKVNNEYANKKISAQIVSAEKQAINLSDAIKISPTSKTSSVLEISITAENILRGKELLSKLVEIYNLQAVQDKNQIAYNTALFIEDRLKSLTVELSTVEKNVEQFKTTNKITDITSEADLFIKQTGDNEDKIKEVETQLNVVKYIEGFVNEDKNKDRLIPNIGITDPGLSLLINKYNELFLEKERIQRASTPTNPVLKNLSEELSSMRVGIKGSISNVKKSLLITKSDLDSDDKFTTNKIQQIPRIEREFLEIKRQQQIKETLYLFLLQKREETNLSLAATAPKAKIVSQPRAEVNPVSPKKGLILLLSLVIGLVIPVVAIYIKRLFETTVKSREELELKSAAPVLGEIPENKSDNYIVVSSNDTSSTTELFRSLRNDLTFILSEPDKKVITITSTVSNEGKTFVALNLANTFALIEKKVVLVGLDIRNPSLAQHLGFSQNKQGITSYLAKGGNIDDIIQKSPINENLDVIFAGIIPPNPNELLNKNGLDTLFDELRKRYDYILVDTAPVGIISDTFLINRVSDVTLYVTRENVTSKESLLFINDLYENNRLTNIFVILNASNIEKKRYGHYRAGHYYGYYYKQDSRKKNTGLNTVKDFIKKQRS